MSREVLVSPGFGAGWSSWNSEYGKQLAEDAELIELVRAGKHTGTTPYVMPADTPAEMRTPQHLRMMEHRCSPEFYERACAVGRANGAPADWHPYCGGVASLEIRTVEGPYRIDEYDGSESLTQASEEVWW